MAKSLKTDDAVTWNTPNGKTDGVVTERATGGTRVKGHVAKPDAASPQYKVKSRKTGAQAVHKAAALTKVKG